MRSSPVLSHIRVGQLLHCVHHGPPYRYKYGRAKPGAARIRQSIDRYVPQVSLVFQRQTSFCAPLGKDAHVSCAGVRWGLSDHGRHQGSQPYSVTDLLPVGCGHWCALEANVPISDPATLRGNHLLVLGSSYQIGDSHHVNRQSLFSGRVAARHDRAERWL